MLDNLPLSDIPMLVSAINCLLRDREFDNLDDICGYYDIERSRIDSVLRANGYEYSPQDNKVVLNQ